MIPRQEVLCVPGAAGQLELAISSAHTDILRPAPRGLALIAHPHPLHGGTMDNKVAQTLAKAFSLLGYTAVRFNFRGVGKSEGSFDDGRGETEDALAALTYAQHRHGAGPVVLAGFSFGAFVQTRVAAKIAAERLVLVGPAVSRFEVGQVPSNTLVIHGEEDDIVPLAAVFAWARPQQLPVIVFPGCGHFFHGRLTQLQQVIMGAWR